MGPCWVPEAGGRSPCMERPVRARGVGGPGEAGGTWACAGHGPLGGLSLDLVQGGTGEGMMGVLRCGMGRFQGGPPCPSPMVTRTDPAPREGGLQAQTASHLRPRPR